MLDSMLVMSNGGGGTQSKRGTFTSSLSAPVEVHDIGFKPKYLIVSKNAYPNNDVNLLYDEDLNSSQQIMRYYDNGANGWLSESVPSTRRDCIKSIDANGFTFNVSSSAPLQGTYYYYAIG